MSSIITNRGSKHFRRARINIDSMLHINHAVNMQHINIPNTGLFNFSNASAFSFSFPVQYNSSMLTDTACVFSIRTSVSGSAPNLSVFVNKVNKRIEFYAVSTTAGIVSHLTPIGSLQPDRLHNVVISYNNHNVKIYINNRGIYNTTTAITGDFYEAGQLIYIGATPKTDSQASNKSDIYLNNFAIYNKELVVSEVEYLHSTGGLIPASAHDNVLAHYPLTQKHGKKIWDCSNQYNYAKTVMLVPNHGDLINYTDEEAGLLGKSIQTCFKDLYTKNTLKSFGFKMNYTSNTRATIPRFDTNPQIPNFSSGLTIVIKGDFKTSGANVRADIFWDFAVSRYVFSQNSVQIQWAGISNNTVIVNNTNSSIVQDDYKGEYILKLNSTGEVWAFWNKKQAVYTSGTSYSPLTLTQTHGIGAQYSDRELRRFDYLYIFEGALNADQIKNGDWDNLSPIMGYKGVCNGTALKEITGKGQDATLSNHSGYSENEHLIEVKTNLPETVKALRFEKAKSQYLKVENFNATNEKGYTYIVAYALESDRNLAYGDCFFSKRSADLTSQYKILYGDESNPSTVKRVILQQKDNVNGAIDRVFDLSYKLADNLSKIQLIAFTDKDGVAGISTTNRKSFNAIVERNTDNHGDNRAVSFAAINTPLYIGTDSLTTGRYMDAYICFYAIIKGVLSKEEILRLANNSVFENPSLLLQLKYDVQLLPNFNKIINDAGVYKIQDLSPQNHTITMHNYDANDIDPIHVNYKLTPLNNLR